MLETKDRIHSLPASIYHLYGYIVIAVCIQVLSQRDNKEAHVMVTDIFQESPC